MTSALFGLAFAALCTDPRVERLAPPQRDAACTLLTQSTPDALSSTAESLEAVYAQPEFRTARQRSLGAAGWWLARAQAWLEMLFETAGAQTYSNLTRFIVLTLAFIAVLWLGLRRRRGKLSSNRRAGASAEATALQLDDPAVHLERARALATSQPREALREGLLSLLSHLERRRLARPDRVKTNRELVAELPARGAPTTLVVEVDALMQRYDQAFYSLAPVAPDTAAQFLSAVAQVQAR